MTAGGAVTRRKQGVRLKEIVRDVTGQVARVVSGRGTAYSWWYISTPIRIPRDQCARIEQLAKAENLLSFYFPDSGPGDDWTAKVTYEVR